MYVCTKLQKHAAPSSTELEAASGHGDGAQAHLAEQEQGPDTPAKPYGEGRIIEGLQDGSDESSPWKCHADQGIGWAAKGKADQVEKKRKRRAMNWTDEETGMLMKAVPVKRNAKSRFCMSGDTERYLWEGVTRKVPRRDPEECRRSMETLTNPTV